MRTFLAWLGVATLMLLTPAVVHAGAPTALKPYIVLILDTSGSMLQATGSGPPTCADASGNLLPDTKLNHAKCAIYDISNSYGDMVLGLGRFRNKMSGTYPNCCSPGPDVAAAGGCPAGYTCTNDSLMFEMLNSVSDGNNSKTSLWVNNTQNTCTAAGTDPEIWNADSNTPLEGALNGVKCYWTGLNESSTATTCVAIGSGTTTWPTGSAGYNPIVNDPLATQFLPQGCDPSPTCTGANCCASQCRPYIVIFLTDGDETCGGTPFNGAQNLFNTDVTVGGTARRYHVVTDPIGFGTPVPYQPMEDMAHGGGHPDIVGQNEAYYASDQAGLELAMTQIIESSLRSETCNNKDDDCDGSIDEDFPTKGQPCDNGKLGVCKGTGTYGCTADGTGVQCNITNPGGNPQTTCPSGKTCNPAGDEVCGDNLDNDCDGAIDEGCAVCVPTGEICNNKDDDCDGLIDEGITRQCGTGTCLGTETCVNGAFVGCTAKTPTQEICNGLDDDCDGVADGFSQACSNMVTPGGPPSDNPGDSSHNPIPQNICHPGQKNCPIAPPGNGTFGACLGEVAPCNCAPTDHACIAACKDPCDGLDNDCDNLIDEDFVPASCSNNCGVGMTMCVNGQVTCSSQPATTDKTCDNNDDDCDGQIDEDWMCGDPSSVPYVPCSCGTGTTCEQNKCINGQVTCVANPPVQPEQCNCKDDDCDGTVDEGQLCGGGGAQCSDCQCAFPCSGGEFPCPLGKKCNPQNFCVDDPCYGKSCPPVNGNKQVCQDQLQGTMHVGVCVDACSTVTCSPDEVCLGSTGMCAPNDCTTFPSKCTSCQHCQVDVNGVGQCITDVCCGVTCSADQYCEGGQCFSSCAGVSCPNGKRCVLGMCETDPCGMQCPYGEVCDDALGVCKQDTCMAGNRMCPQGQACDPGDGNCKPDPCLGVTCPSPDQICKGVHDSNGNFVGTCYDMSMFQPDAPAGNHVTVGGGGCSTTGGGAGLLVGLALLLVRRRRKGGAS
jgi:hypothetical protein